MGFLEEMHVAAGIDRLIGSLGLKPPAPDPMMTACRQLEQSVREQFARIGAEERFWTRQLAELRERQQPGYIADLNRQRASLGFLPI